MTNLRMGFPLCFGLTTIAFFFAPPEKDGAVLEEEEEAEGAVNVEEEVVEGTVAVEVRDAEEVVDGVLFAPNTAALRDEKAEEVEGKDDAVDGKDEEEVADGKDEEEVADGKDEVEAEEVVEAFKEVVLFELRLFFDSYALSFLASEASSFLACANNCPG